MHRTRRAAVALLFVAALLLAGFLFWPWIVDQIISPLALAGWIFLRIFVLSIDQKYYWGAAICLALVILLRVLPRETPDIPPDDFSQANEALDNIRYWRSIFALTDVNAYDERILKQELTRLVTSLYAAKQPTQRKFIFREALQRGELSLPDPIRDFLFPDEHRPGGSLRELLSRMREYPGKWMRHRNGQETAEYRRMIDEVLTFVEASLEMEDDDEKISPTTN